MMLLFSVLLTGSFYVMSERLLSALGAYGELLILGKEYTTVIILGTVLQVFGTGMVPFMRNYGGAMWAMIAMICGFATNVTLDYVLVWVMNRGMTGAALATVIGQGITMAVALVYCAAKRKLFLKMTSGDMGVRALQIIKIGLAPFGLTLAPEISLVVINRFSASRSNRCAVRFVAGSQCGNHNGHANFPAFPPGGCRYKSDIGRLLRNGEKRVVLFADSVGAGVYAGTGADSAAAVGRSDYDLVELRCSENHYGSGGHCAVCFYKDAERA